MKGLTDVNAPRESYHSTLKMLQLQCGVGVTLDVLP